MCYETASSCNKGKGVEFQQGVSSSGEKWFLWESYSLWRVLWAGHVHVQSSKFKVQSSKHLLRYTPRMKGQQPSWCQECNRLSTDTHTHTHTHTHTNITLAIIPATHTDTHIPAVPSLLNMCTCVCVCVCVLLCMCMRVCVRVWLFVCV